jgi:hypothetical protein
VIHDIQSGRADLGVAGARAWDGLGVKLFQALGAPFLIHSYALEQRVLQGPLRGEPHADPDLRRGRGIAPGNATYKPREQLAHAWSLYHDVLTSPLSANSPDAPTPWRAVPWRRITSTPSASYFPRRCPPPANALPR